MTEQDPSTDGAETRTPSPGAQAASRARRIGGRPSPRPRPAPSPDEDLAVAAATDGDAVPAPAPYAGERTAEAAAAPAPGRVSTAKRPAPAPPAPAADDVAVAGRRLDRLRWVPAGVAAAAVLVLAVLLVTLSHGVWWAKPSASATRDEVLAAAKTCLAKTNTYDYRTLDKAEADGLACATGKFRDAYKQSFENVVKKIAPERKAAQEVQVDKAGVESVSRDGTQWVVLIYGQQKVTNTTTQQPRLDILSARVTMDRVGGQWLISALSAA